MSFRIDFRYSRLLAVLGALVFLVKHSPAQTLAERTAGSREQTTTSLAYLPTSGERPESATRISEYQKLMDDKNYERSTAFRVSSINGGEQVQREISEKSRKISDSQYQVERTIRRPDPSGRLTTDELIKEEHTLKGNTEETQRSYYRSDINSKMAPQAVENEVIVKTSPREKQMTRALYRPDPEGKFSLSEMEEGIERKVSDALTVKESSRKRKETNGRMAVLESVKETTTKLNDKSFRKETVMHRAGDEGRLFLSDKVTETQSEGPDGVRKYQRLLESRNVNRQLPNLNSTGLILSERVTGEERRMPDGSIQSTMQIESIDPLSQSNGLRLSEIVTETTRPLANGKLSVERLVKTRDANGNFTVSQKIAQTIEPAR
jgi:hypothetical protein